MLTHINVRVKPKYWEYTVLTHINVRVNQNLKFLIPDANLTFILCGTMYDYQFLIFIST